MGKWPRNAACVACVLVLVVGLAAGESPGGTATVFHIQTATPSQQLAERYVSVTIDASNCQRGFAPLNEPSVSYKAQVLGKALSPAVLRIGGTSGDALTYNMSDDSTGQPNTLTKTGWDTVNVFALTAGWQVVFGLNALTRFPNGTWDPSNARELVEYTVAHSYPVAGWELGNEPDLWYEKFNTTVPPMVHAQDFVVLRAMLEEIYTTYGVPMPMVIGPDVATLNRNNYFSEFLDAASALKLKLDAITIHQYYFDGHTATEKDFLSVSDLDELGTYVNDAQQLINQADTVTQTLWLGETSSAYDGGTPGLSNEFTSTFVWLDKLGLAGALGVNLLARQDFFGGFYGLLNHTDLSPLPDFWTSALFKKLTSAYMFEIDGQTQPGRVVRAYSWCAQPSVSPSAYGGATVLFLNVQGVNASVELAELPATPRHEYHVSSGAWDAEKSLLTTTTLLNNQPLHLEKYDGALFLPVMEPMYVDNGGPSTVELGPYSATFVVYPLGVGNVCQQAPP